MAGMEIDSPPAFSPYERVVQRLVQHGIPLGQLDQSPWCLVVFMRENKLLIPKLVSSILPSEHEILKIQKLSMKESGGSSGSGKVKELYAESLLWIQWMMFQGDPQDFLKNMAQESADKRAVCGVVWGWKDLAYRCRTCEHDPTCAICVPCFQNGNHEDHDYSIIYTGGGCCDCGDETAWKREGFCSKHKGTNLIKPLPEELANSVGPVLDALLSCWMDTVVFVEQHKFAKVGDRSDSIEVANELSSAVVEMFLSFCNCSESLLSFTGRRMLECSGLVSVIIRAERFLGKNVVKKIHELLLKLLGDIIFKYEFAKFFIEYYPITVKELTEESTDSMFEKYPLLSTFSVQIFTVPTLTPQLVREVNLLGVLLGCLTDHFFSCVAEDGSLQARNWANVHEITIRLVEDTRYVMSHSEVLIYIARERPEIARAWLHLLSLVQGMDPLKRATIHLDEDYDKLYATFVLGHYLGNIHTLLVEGAYSITSEEMDCSDRQGSFVIDNHCSMGIGRFPQESTSCSTSRNTEASGCSLQYSVVNFDRGNTPAFPPFAVWLIIECLKTIESWLGPDSGRRNLEATSSGNSNFWTLRKTFSRIKKSMNSTKVRRTAISRTYMNENLVHPRGEGREMFGSSSSIHGASAVLGQDNDTMDVCDMKDRYPGHSSSVYDNSLMEVDSGMDFEAFNMLKSADWPDINYDVKSQEISFHIPLHRLLSLLLRKALNICYGETGKRDKANCTSAFSSSRQNGFFGQVLKGLHPCGFSAYIMEHPLRLRVFCAQVMAGMWRKNGDAAILSSEWYRFVQWLEQGLESDLFLLQCCASLAPPELFVKSIQQRFGLSSYTSLNLADHNEYESVLVQEMLTLIIQVVTERRFCGLSTSENLRRELVCRLAIGDATHSQVVKALPRDLSKSTQLRDILDVLAAYSKPSGVKQGKYSLRKEFWKELDLYHPRWKSRDLQVALERYSNVCKVSALNIQLPRWTAIFDPLSSISRIATSKTVLQITRAVIFYAVFTEMPSISRASEGVLVTALHLLSLGLDICQTQLSCDGQLGVDLSCQADDLFPILMYAIEEIDESVVDKVLWKNQSLLSLLVALLRKYKEESDYNNADTGQFSITCLAENILKKFAELSPNCMNKLKRLAPDLICHTLHHFPKNAVKSSAFTSDMDERKAKARKHQADIMSKMRAEQSNFLASLKSEANDEIDSTVSNTDPSILEVDHVNEESAPVCSLCRGSDAQSPLCFFVLLQKSRLTHIIERGPVSWKDVHQSEKETCSISTEGVTNLSGAGTSTPVQSGQDADIALAIGTEPDAIQDSFSKWLTEISNAELPNVSYNSSTSSLSSLEILEDDAYQSVLGEIRDSQSHSDDSAGESSCLTADIADSLKKSKGETSNSSSRVCVFSPRGCDGIHISSCGHAVHKECHDRYLISLKQRRRHQLGFEGAHVVDPDLGELLCPVCRRFANSILPAFTGDSIKTLRKPMSSAEGPTLASFSPSDTDNNKLRLPLALSLLRATSKMVSKSRFTEILCGKQNVTLEPALEPALHKLCVLYWSHSYNNLSAGRLSPSLVLWDTLRYSLVSAEIAARGRVKTCSVGSVSLDTLYGELHSSSGFILSLLLSVAQTARSSSHHEVLLRYKGIQLLAGSICTGMSGDNCFSYSDKQQVTLSSILEHVDKGEVFPDIQFCKQAADPILAHDPFSSLMLVLFCLPLRFISSNEFFVPLVHLFYTVCVIQALITCNAGQYFDDSCFSDCVLNDICKTMGKFEFVRKYFVSNYIDNSCNSEDTIRRLTFPYLRRCALFWKLLKSSMLAPLYDSSHGWEGPTPFASYSSFDNSDCLKLELNGVRELEDMFQIHSLDSVLKDKLVHRLALKWCEHFCDDFRVRNCGLALFSLPAVPFKLIQLPQLYQEILQRYVKGKCSHCKSVLEEPALCLLCGSLCSPGWKSCCRSIRCLNHAAVCGAGIGVFLLVRRTTILLNRSLRQAFWPSPYLDAFGEEDNDVSRGRPLYLSEERYASLTYLVASHGLDRTSEVLRQTTIGLNGSD